MVVLNDLSTSGVNALAILVCSFSGVPTLVENYSLWGRFCSWWTFYLRLGAVFSATRATGLGFAVMELLATHCHESHGNKISTSMESLPASPFATWGTTDLLVAHSDWFGYKTVTPLNIHSGSPLDELFSKSSRLYSATFDMAKVTNSMAREKTGVR